MSNIKDISEAAKKRDENTSLSDIIFGLSSHNCDMDRPLNEQQPSRASMAIEGLTRRDICDCMVLGMIRSSDKKYPEIFVSDNGNRFETFEALDESGEGYNYSYPDPRKISYNDVYDMGDFDLLAAVKNMACHLEMRMGVFPALLDENLKVEKEIKE